MLAQPKHVGRHDHARCRRGAALANRRENGRAVCDVAVDAGDRLPAPAHRALRGHRASEAAGAHRDRTTAGGETQKEEQRLANKTILQVQNLVQERPAG